MTAELLQYCKDQLAAGYSEEQIRAALRQQGWDPTQANSVLRQAQHAMNSNVMQDAISQIAEETTSAVSDKGTVIPDDAIGVINEVGVQPATLVPDSSSSSQSPTPVSHISQASSRLEPSIVSETVVPTGTEVGGPPWGRIATVMVTLVLLLGLAGGGVWGYYTLWMSPERILGAAMMNERENPLVSAQYESRIVLELRSTESKLVSEYIPAAADSQVLGVSTSEYGLPERVVLSMDATGAFDMSDLEAIQSETSIDWKMEGMGDLYGTEIPTSEMGFDLKMPNQEEMAVRARMELPEQLGLDFFEQYVNQWIYINLGELEEEMGTELVARDEQVLTDEQTARLQAMVWESQVATVTETLDPGALDGQQMYRYALSIDKDKLVDLLFAMSNELTEGEPLTEEDTSAMREALAYVTDISAELWVGRDDLRFHRVVLSVEIASSEDAAEGTLLIDISWWDVNQPVTVTIPSGAVDYKQVMEAYEQYMSEQYQVLYLDRAGDDSVGLEAVPAE